MRYSYNWLKELSGSDASVEKMAEMMTKHAFEVESVEKGADIPDTVIVGEVLSVEKHPNADKLKVTKVNVGEEHGGDLTIVCGAPNVSQGQKVVVATAGTRLPNGITIKKTDIRGIESNGMICAEDELGLGENHTGIMVMDKEAVVGLPISRFTESADSVIELDILANRGHDALSHIAIAREIAAIERRHIEENAPKRIAQKSKELTVDVDSEAGCYRYIGTVLHSVRLNPSPRWMQERLEACGIKPVSNVVDITNYVMLEWGQPLHAFDLKQVKSEFPISNNQSPNEIRNTKYEIRVRTARKNEQLTLLDDSIINLDSQDIVITDGEKPLALAGVMGGMESGISDETTSIILEAATFDAATIRKTRQRHKLSTESSYRFERDLDPNLTEKAVARAVELLEEHAGATIEGSVDIYPAPVEPWNAQLHTDRVRSLLGHTIPDNEIADILEYLGFGIHHSQGDMVVTVPTHRRDIFTAEDIIEEVGRMHGYDTIEAVAPREAVQSVSKNPALMLERKFAEKLLSLGFDEILTYSFYSEKQAIDFGFLREKHLSLAHPMNPNQVFVRTNILPNILEKVSENVRRESSARLFEIGKCYTWNAGKKKYTEKRQCAMAQVLEKNLQAGEGFFALKGVLENMAQTLFGKAVTLRAPIDPESYWHKSRCGEISVGKKNIGMIGEINPMLARKLGIKKSLAMALLDINACLAYEKKPIVYKPISPYPSITRDISLLVPEKVTYSDTIRIIRESGEKMLTNIKLFDVFEKGKEKSFAFHLIFSDPDRTLTKEDADEAVEKILDSLKETLGVQLKG